jgi:hypothetical protein
MSFTTSDLLDSIKRRSFAPAGQTTFTDAELLAMADEETKTTILPDILSVREEFFINHYDYSITAGTAAYAIPSRSIGLQVRDVHIVDGTTVIPDFPRIEPEAINTGMQGIPSAFYLKNNAVCLFPTPSSTSKTLRLYFPLRPSRLVDTAEAAVITAINGATVTVSSIPSSWVTGDIFDLIKQDGGQECRSIDLTSTLVSGSDITLPSVPDGLRVGDYIALSNESPLVQLPPDYYEVLAQAVATIILEDMNQPGADRARKKLDKMRENVLKLHVPRTPGEPRVIAPNTWGI